jgi:hypothetical protein
MLTEQSDGEKDRMNRYGLLLTMWILGDLATEELVAKRVKADR